jgi:glycogen operon protein
MIAFRKAHPSLGRSRFWRYDIHWYGVGPQVDLSGASHSLAWCLRGASQGDDDLYAMVNASPQALDFTVQERAPAPWRRVVDTGRESPDDIREPGQEVPQTSACYTVGPRSVVVLMRPASRSAAEE